MGERSRDVVELETVSDRLLENSIATGPSAGLEERLDLPGRQSGQPRAVDADEAVADLETGGHRGLGDHRVPFTSIIENPRDVALESDDGPAALGPDLEGRRALWRRGRSGGTTAAMWLPFWLFRPLASKAGGCWGQPSPKRWAPGQPRDRCAARARRCSGGGDALSCGAQQEACCGDCSCLFGSASAGVVRAREAARSVGARADGSPGPFAANPNVS